MMRGRVAASGGKGATGWYTRAVRERCGHVLCAIVLACAFASAGAQEKRASGAELAATCTTALAHGYSGVEAEACNWYVAPCPVCGKKPSDGAEWCAPRAATNTDIATAYVDGMRANPALGERSARVAVKEILGKAYPCTR